MISVGNSLPSNQPLLMESLQFAETLKMKRQDRYLFVALMRMVFWIGSYGQVKGVQWHACGRSKRVEILVTVQTQAVSHIYFEIGWFDDANSPRELFSLPHWEDLDEIKILSIPAYQLDLYTVHVEDMSLEKPIPLDSIQNKAC